MSTVQIDRLAREAQLLTHLSRELEKMAVMKTRAEEIDKIEPSKLTLRVEWVWGASLPGYKELVSECSDVVAAMLPAICAAAIDRVEKRAETARGELAAFHD